MDTAAHLTRLSAEVNDVCMPIRWQTITIRLAILSTMQWMDPNGDWIRAEAELAGPDGLAYVRQVVDEWTIDSLS